MTLGSIITWVIVGATAGFMAEWLVGDVRTSGIGTAFIGVVGALAGGWLFDYLQIWLGLGILVQDILTASIGALFVLLLFKFIRFG
jgi:uncharacterized membrane protein YeaQ/YmgE (transglycosylase-associated protein family)